MKKVLLFIFTFILILGCKQSNDIEEEHIDCCCPGCTIYIQPYEDFSKDEVNKILPELKKQFDHWLYGSWVFEVLDPIPLPTKSDLSNKYKAVDILNFQKSKIKGNEVILGLTHKDICTNVHGFKNYGILGLSYRFGSVCIVSDKRLSNKNNIWKVILHEFIHSYYGDNHCPNDDPTCFMVDAKGKGNIAIQNKLCNSCNKQ